MISSVEIKYFRGIREGKLEGVAPLTVLVGPNGSGKSTILDALLIGASPAPGDAIGRAVRRHQWTLDGARWLFWRANEHEGTKIVVRTEGEAMRRCELKLSEPQPKNALGITARLEDKATDKTVSQEVKVEFLQNNSYKPDKAFTPVEGVSEIRLVEAHVPDLQTPLHRLYTAAVEQGRRLQAKSIVAAAVPRLIDVEILTAGDSPVVHLVFDEYSVPAGLSGDGIHSLVRLAFELASRRHGVVLLEEPEVHQHPRAMRQTARAILAAVRRDIQVILTTHSLELIDSLLAEFRDEEELQKLSVYRLELEDGLLKSCRHPGPEVAFARGTIEDDLR